MSRDICVSLFDEIIKLRPEWAGTKLTKDGKDIGWNHEDGAIRIVMTGTASDRPGLQNHVYSKGQKKRMATRFKDAKDPLKLVIVRDMWLTGFDAPCCHTMYVDKPMAGHMERRTPIRRVHEMPMLGGKPLSIDSPWASAIRRSPLLSMGDATLKKLASELTEKLRNSTTVDWQFRDSVRAKMRILIRQLLRKYKYPPEGCEEAIGLVLKQAEALADDWTGER